LGVIPAHLLWKIASIYLDEGTCLMSSLLVGDFGLNHCPDKEKILCRDKTSNSLPAAFPSDKPRLKLQYSYLSESFLLGKSSFYAFICPRCGATSIRPVSLVRHDKGWYHHFSTCLLSLFLNFLASISRSSA